MKCALLCMHVQWDTGKASGHFTQLKRDFKKIKNIPFNSTMQFNETISNVRCPIYI